MYIRGDLMALSTRRLESNTSQIDTWSDSRQEKC